MSQENHTLALKSHKIRQRWGLSGPAGGAYSAPQTLWLNGRAARFHLHNH